MVPDFGIKQFFHLATYFGMWTRIRHLKSEHLKMDFEIVNLYLDNWVGLGSVSRDFGAGWTPNHLREREKGKKAQKRINEHHIKVEHAYWTLLSSDLKFVA